MEADKVGWGRGVLIVATALCDSRVAGWVIRSIQAQTH